MAVTEKSSAEELLERADVPCHVVRVSVADDLFGCDGRVPAGFGDLATGTGIGHVRHNEGHTALISTGNLRPPKSSAVIC